MVHDIDRRAFLKHACRVAPALSIASGNLLQGENPREFSRGGMVYRRLGHTDIYPSLLGFGSHINRKYRVRDPVWGSRLNQEGQRLRDRRVELAIDRGITFFDIYDNSGQWEPMARLVKGRRHKLVLSLKKERPGPTADIIDHGAGLFGHMDLFRFVIYDEGELTRETYEKWDIVRKGKEAGKIRSIGIATHLPGAMRRALRELEGLDFIFLPFNFIHSHVAYTEFLPEAIQRGVGLLAMKPLGSGSITLLDPNRPRKDATPEGQQLSLSLRNLRDRTPLLEEAVQKLTRELDRGPDETLAQAALRFVFSQPFITTALPGMWLEEEVLENQAALAEYASGQRAAAPALGAAARVASLTRQAWLPGHYRWLDQRWKPKAHLPG